MLAGTPSEKYVPPGIASAPFGAPLWSARKYGAGPLSGSAATPSACVPDR